MELDKVNKGFQNVGKFFDRAFKSLTFSNLISCIAGALLMLGLLSSGFIGIIALVAGFFLFLASGLFLADKEDALFLADMKNELRADLRKIRQEIEAEHRKAASSYPPSLPTGVMEDRGKTSVYQRPAPVQILPGQLPVSPPRRRTSSKVTIIEEDSRKTIVKQPTPSTPPRPRRKTGA